MVGATESFLSDYAQAQSRASRAAHQAYQNQQMAYQQAKSTSDLQCLMRNAANPLAPYRPMEPIQEKPAPEMRTREQIMADLEARYAEMEQEAARPERMYPCKTCRWESDFGTTCSQPLVMGMDALPIKNPPWTQNEESALRLCGPEKALWEPTPVRLTLWQRIINFFRECNANG